METARLSLDRNLNLRVVASPVFLFLWEQMVAGSIPAAPTIFSVG
jgi:hypothetical protein